MSEISWFSFENKDLDFPIYKNNPHVPKWGWIVLLIAMFFGFILMMGSSIFKALLSMLVLLIPLLYFLKWDDKAIFQKPKAKDVALAVALFVGYIIYALLMGVVLENFGLTGGELIDPAETTLMSIPPLFFSLMSEELIKFIPFMFFMRVVYKYSNNRKLSVILSMFIVMIFFAGLHALDFKMFIFAIFIQGFGSIFEFIGYIKTKNILISYITHLCTDVFIFILIILGVA